jgi:hypothetical protein
VDGVCGVQQFLLKHNIHVVALSPEYDTPDDQFYAGARELGTAHPPMTRARNTHTHTHAR